ncbi:hypothetical protein [Galactobacillus timonensis]|uniref:hypothetical protein n=1 Tax=Galactobacillus timonensis TaxID=2041840 RepID=UPI000C83C094|nr:hypothetical protein [Galactobacillus timonensis]
MNTDTDEIEIDLFDLFKNITKKWKQILIITVAGIAVAVPSALPKKQETVESLKAALEPDRVEYVEDIYSDYKIAFDNEQIASTNLADSPIININAFKAPRTVGTFIISSDITEAWRLFEPLTQDENFCGQVATILNLEDAAHAADMISFTGYSDEANALYEQTPLSVMKVTAYVYSSDEGPKMQQMISDFIKAKSEAFNAEGINLTVQNVEWTYVERFDINLQKRQQELYQSKSLAYQEVTDYEEDVKAKLSEEEIAYFNALASLSEPAEAEPKKIVIGAFVGLFLGMLFYALRYIMAGVIHTEHDSEILYKTTSYGVVHKETIEQDIAMITAQINTQVSVAKASTLFIQTDDDNKDILNKIKNNINNVTIHSGNITDDPESYQSFVSADIVIALTTIGRTKTKQIEKMRLLKKYGYRITDFALTFNL